MRAPLAALIMVAAASSSGNGPSKESARESAAAPVAAGAQADPYLWLEDVEGARALEWVNQRDREAVARFEADPGYEPLRAQFLGLLDSPDRIPYVGRMGGDYYNFWRDAAHPRGLWRRTPLAGYREQAPEWETVLDLDALAGAENENWVWQGADCLRPDSPQEPYGRCLISLSRGGADAVVVREFDLRERRFVDGGFSLAEAKSTAGWKDLDTIWVGTDFGPGSMTSSGYPRIVKSWRRGTPLAEAQTVFEGQPSDVSVDAESERESGVRRDWVRRGIAFWKSEWFLLRDGRQIKLEIPLDADRGLFQDQLLVYLRSPWHAGGSEYAAGSVLAIGFEAFLKGARNFAELYRPGAGRVFRSMATTRGAVLIGELDHVRSRWIEVTRDGGAWHSRVIATPPASQVDVALTYWDSDDYLLDVQSYTAPNELVEARVGAGPQGASAVLKRLPPVWDAHEVEARQYEAVSRDGTKIPYFVVARKGLKPDGSHATLLTGYGGFEISLLPAYPRLTGKGWIEPGGVFAVANIRGGGEFGPAWHEAALKENRQRCFDDFAAVAQDLIRRGITSPKHLGIMGGSNGGLLVTATMEQHPELFGAVVSQVPLTDMLRFNKLLAGASWMAEYGDPDDPADRAAIERYSPYQNVRAGVRYPPIFFVTSTRDDRVHPGHARKMAARMLEVGNEVWYYENVEGGHGAAADNAQAARMWAQTFSFLRQKLGVGGR
jgi:prolyl oligopeptidase